MAAPAPEEQPARRQLSPEEVAAARRAINEDLMVDEDQLYAGPRGEIRQMFDDGVVLDADFMVVGSDGFDLTNFPIYHYAGDEDTTAATVTRLRANGDKAMEVYDLRDPREPQIDAHRIWNDERTREIKLMASKDREKKTLPGISSQAGLSTYEGADARYAPSVPAHGEPGSKSNPIFVSRAEQTKRREQGQEQPGAVAGINPPDDKGVPNAARSLAVNAIGLPPGFTEGAQAVDPGAGAQAAAETGVAAASIKGFSQGFANGARAGGPPAPTRRTPNAPDTSVPGTSQPLIVDAVDAVQGNPPASAGESGKKVVMNPEHQARIDALDGQDFGDLQVGNDRYGR